MLTRHRFDALPQKRGWTGIEGHPLRLQKIPRRGPGAATLAPPCFRKVSVQRKSRLRAIAGRVVRTAAVLSRHDALRNVHPSQTAGAGAS